MSRIKTIGDLRKLIEDLDDEYKIDMRVNRNISPDALQYLMYPWGIDTDYQEGFEFDDVGVSDKVLCISVDVPDDMCRRIRREAEPPKFIERVNRPEDMSTVGSLELFRGDDGDIHVVMWYETEDGLRMNQSIEFCNTASGGGHSPHTFKALQSLMEAMQKDNEEHPISRKKEG